MQKLEKIIIEQFPAIICAFSAFWFALIAYGLFNS
jgi:hypothetical protein